MKKNALMIMILAVLIVFTHCKKDDKEDLEDRFTLLTTTTWVADSLLANGVDASGPGQLLEDFKGEARFNADGTGKFGEYTGTWKLQTGDTEIVIQTDAHPIPITAKIEELTKTSLKIFTGFPDLSTGQLVTIPIRMTFKAR